LLEKISFHIGEFFEDEIKRSMVEILVKFGKEKKEKFLLTAEKN